MSTGSHPRRGWLFASSTSHIQFHCLKTRKPTPFSLVVAESHTQPLPALASRGFFLWNHWWSTLYINTFMYVMYAKILRKGSRIYNYTKHTCCIASIIFLQYLGGRLHWRNMSIFTQYQRMSWRKTTSFETYGEWKKSLADFQIYDISENILITF